MQVKELLIAGFTAVDLLGLGTLGHVAGVGIVLGLKVCSIETSLVWTKLSQNACSITINSYRGMS